MAEKTLRDHLNENGGDPALAWKALMGATDEHLALARSWIEKGAGVAEGRYEHQLNHKPFAFHEAMKTAMWAHKLGARAPVGED
jgi:hypothetical protein